MANYEKIVVIPASLEEEFHRFLQKGNGLSKTKTSTNVIKEEAKPIKSILKNPVEQGKKKTVKKAEKKKSPPKKQVKWLKL